MITSRTLPRAFEARTSARTSSSEAASAGVTVGGLRFNRNRGTKWLGSPWRRWSYCRKVGRFGIDAWSLICLLFGIPEVPEAVPSYTSREFRILISPKVWRLNWVKVLNKFWGYFIRKSTTLYFCARILDWCLKGKCPRIWWWFWTSALPAAFKCSKGCCVSTYAWSCRFKNGSSETCRCGCCAKPVPKI